MRSVAYGNRNRGRSMWLGKAEGQADYGRHVISGRVIVTVSVILSLLAVVFALATRWSLTANLRTQSQSGSSRLNGAAVWSSGTRPAPEIRLRDQAGERFSLAGQQGKVVVLTFLDSKCTTLCPMEASQLKAVGRQLAGMKIPVELVVVSTDPEGDTPSSVTAFAARSGWNGIWSWHWLNGPANVVSGVWHAYDVSVNSQGHTVAVYVIDRSGYERVGLEVPFQPDVLGGDIRALA